MFQKGLMYQSGKEPEIRNKMKKCCADCKTTKTPLWRVGPAGPRSLCNACGIKYRKMRSGVLCLKQGIGKRREKPTTTTTTTITINTNTSKKINRGGSCKGGNLREDLRVKLTDLGKEMVLLQGQRSPMNIRNLGEEEQAAFLLMALSCGSVFA